MSKLFDAFPVDVTCSSRPVRARATRTFAFEGFYVRAFDTTKRTNISEAIYRGTWGRLTWVYMWEARAAPTKLEEPPAHWTTPERGTVQAYRTVLPADHHLLSATHTSISIHWDIRSLGRGPRPKSRDHRSGRRPPAGCPDLPGRRRKRPSTDRAGSDRSFCCRRSRAPGSRREAWRDIGRCSGPACTGRRRSR